MGSDMYMNPPKYIQVATWEGDLLVLRAGYDRADEVVWQGTEEEYQKVKKLIRVTIPPKPNSPTAIAAKNKDVLNTLYAEAKNRAQNVLSNAGVEDLQHPVEVGRQMCRAFMKEFSDYYEDGGY